MSISPFGDPGHWTIASSASDGSWSDTQAAANLKASHAVWVHRDKMERNKRRMDAEWADA